MRSVITTRLVDATKVHDDDDDDALFTYVLHCRVEGCEAVQKG